MVTFVLNKTVPGTCPTEQPELGSSCSLPDLTQCSYGEECCCGKCHPRSAFMSLRNPKNSSTLHYFPSLTKTTRKIQHCLSSLTMECGNGIWNGFYNENCLSPSCELTKFHGTIPFTAKDICEVRISDLSSFILCASITFSWSV